MPTEKEMAMIQKATIYDLVLILKNGSKDSYTVEELNDILETYVKGIESK